MKGRRRLIQCPWDGLHRTITSAAAISGIPAHTIRRRLELGWSASDIFAPLHTVRAGRKAQRVQVGDELLTVAEIAARAGVKTDTIRLRVAAGDTGDRLLRPSRQSGRKATAAEVRELIDSGLSLYQAAHELGVSHQTIKRRLGSQG
jgi:hypothetical protein